MVARMYFSVTTRGGFGTVRVVPAERQVTDHHARTSPIASAIAASGAGA